MTTDDDERPRLLFLAQVLPHPPDGGVKIRTHNILRLLAREFEVTALCFYRVRGNSADEDVEARVEALRRHGEVEAFPIPQEESLTRRVWDHLRSVVTRRAYAWYVYESSAYRSRLEELLRRREFDVVHMDSLDLAAYLPLLESQHVVCTHHNVESELLVRRARMEASRLKGRYLRHQAELTRRMERQWCGKVELNVTVSKEDRRTLAGIAPDARFEVIPNGVDTDYFTPADAETSEPSGIVFVGGTSWAPNRDAMIHFCEQILPRVRDRVGDVPVRWIGRADQRDRRRFSRRFGIELTGYVDDIRPHVRSAACYVAPLRVGGGTRLKILDAWAMGKAVVSTYQGCEGLKAVDGENILVRDTPEGFAEAVEEVLARPELREELGRRARKTACRHYGWDVLGRRQSELYRHLVGAGEKTVRSERPEAAATASAAGGAELV